MEESFIKFLLAQEQYWILLNCIDKFHQIKPIEVQETLFLKCKKIDFLLENIEAFKDLPDYKLVNNKVIVASEEELEINSRSKSAKLRIIERVK